MLLHKAHLEVQINQDTEEKLHSINHHQTWLVNYNEIREEVNSATADNVPDRIIYQKRQRKFCSKSSSCQFDDSWWGH